MQKLALSLLIILSLFSSIQATYNEESATWEDINQVSHNSTETFTPNFDTVVETRQNTQKIHGKDEQLAANLIEIFENSPQPKGYCVRENPEWPLKASDLCGEDIYTNIIWKWTFTFNETEDARYRMHIGSDFGQGGAFFLDGNLLQTRNDDLWWNKNWHSSDVVKLIFDVSAGMHKIEIYGAENCCSGKNNIRVKRITRDISDIHVLAEARKLENIQDFNFTSATNDYSNMDFEFAENLPGIFEQASQPDGYCSQENPVWPLSLSSMCVGGPETNILWKWTFTFTETEEENAKYVFTFKPDFGIGGVWFIDGSLQTIILNGNWMDFNNNNSQQIKQSIIAEFGVTHTIEVYGASNCCDGNNLFSFKKVSVVDMTEDEDSNDEPQEPIPSEGISMFKGEEGGFCVKHDFSDENEGVIKLDGGDYNTQEKKCQCLQKCAQYQEENQSSSEITWVAFNGNEESSSGSISQTVNEAFIEGNFNKIEFAASNNEQAAPFVLRGLNFQGNLDCSNNENNNSENNFSRIAVLGRYDHQGRGNERSWGEIANDGKLNLNAEGIKGYIQAFNKDGQQGEVAFHHDGIGIKGDASNEIEIGETLEIFFDDDQCYYDAFVGFDSLYGNYNSMSKPDARVVWVADYNGENVRTGETQNDVYNSDGDGQRETIHVYIHGKFNHLKFYTYSPNNINSNFVLRFIDLVKSCCNQEICGFNNSYDVTLGSIYGSDSLFSFGYNDGFGKLHVDQDGLFGQIYAFSPEGNHADVAFSHNGLGVSGVSGGEIELGETVVFDFREYTQKLFDVTVGFDSLYGHYDKGSDPDARVTWKAYLNNDLVEEGEIQNDSHDNDGDNKRETNQIYVNGQFDYLEFSTYSPSNINSNFVIRYVNLFIAQDQLYYENDQDYECNDGIQEFNLESFDLWGSFMPDGSLQINYNGMLASINAFNKNTDNIVPIIIDINGIQIPANSVISVELHNGSFFDAYLFFESQQLVTGCEVIWDQNNRGCYVHTSRNIAYGNWVPRHSCWIAAQNNEEVVEQCIVDENDNNPCKKGYSGFQEICYNSEDNFHELIDKSVFESETACQVLVNTHQSTCNEYCHMQGKVCVAAQDNQGNGCTLEEDHERQDTGQNGCNQSWSNQVCVCDEQPITISPCEGYTGFYQECHNLPQQFHSEIDRSFFEHVENVCQVQVYTKYGTCDSYCQNQGKVCLAAQDNIHNTCNLDPHHERQSMEFNGCHQSWNNQICICGDEIPQSEDESEEECETFIEVYSAGYLDGNYCKIVVNGEGLNVEYSRGFNFASFDLEGNFQDFIVFDVYGSFYDFWNQDQVKKELVNWISGVPEGWTVAAGCMDECGFHTDESVYEALRTIGWNYSSELQYRDAFAMIGFKGAQPGSVRQKIGRKGNPGTAHVKDCISYKDGDNQDCQPPCMTCQPGTTLCETCIYSIRVLENNCACPEGYFSDANFECTPCAPQCKHCFEQADLCETCTGENRDIENGCQCSFGFFENPNGICEPCAHPCQSCSQEATSCDSCVPSIPERIATEGCGCPETYQSQTDLDQCTPECSFPCETCISGSHTCETCSGDIRVPELGCGCPEGYLENSNNECQACSNKCLTCSENVDQCDVCSSEERDANNNCACPEGFFDDGVNAECQRCVHPCKTCSSADVCDTCVESNPAREIDNNCDCPSGYYNMLTYPQCFSSCQDAPNQQACMQCVDDEGRRFLWLNGQYCKPQLCLGENATIVPNVSFTGNVQSQLKNVQQDEEQPQSRRRRSLEQSQSQGQCFTSECGCPSAFNQDYCTVENALDSMAICQESQDYCENKCNQTWCGVQEQQQQQEQDQEQQDQEISFEVSIQMVNGPLSQDCWDDTLQDQLGNTVQTVVTDLQDFTFTLTYPELSEKCNALNQDTGKLQLTCPFTLELNLADSFFLNAYFEVYIKYDVAPSDVQKDTVPSEIVFNSYLSASEYTEDVELREVEQTGNESQPVEFLQGQTMEFRFQLEGAAQQENEMEFVMAEKEDPETQETEFVDPPEQEQEADGTLKLLFDTENWKEEVKDYILTIHAKLKQRKNNNNSGRMLESNLEGKFVKTSIYIRNNGKITTTDDIIDNNNQQITENNNNNNDENEKQSNQNINKESSSSTGAVIGGVIGGAVVLAILTGVCMKLKSNKKEQQDLKKVANKYIVSEQQAKDTMQQSQSSDEKETNSQKLPNTKLHKKMSDFANSDRSLQNSLGKSGSGLILEASPASKNQKSKFARQDTNDVKSSNQSQLEMFSINQSMEQ